MPVSQRETVPHSSPALSQRATLPLAPAMGLGADPRKWEVDALLKKEERAIQTEMDLTFQIDALQRELNAKNEAFDTELVFATGQLEGALSALRRLTSELARTIDDGVRILQRRE